MENNEGYTNNTSTWVTFEEEEEEEVLSFSNFSTTDHNKSESSSSLDDHVISPRDSSISSSADHDHHDVFAGFFSTTHHELISPSGSFIFCGKMITNNDQQQLNEYPKRDYLSTVRSKSSRGRPASSDQDPFININYENNTDPHYPLRKNRSISLRFSGSRSPRYSASSNDQKVNITSLTSMSATSRRRMFMFGPVKFKPEMELSAIKERQGRLRRGHAPATMFPADYDGRTTAASGGGKGSHWRVITSSLRGRAHLAGALTKSFGCIPMPGGGEKGMRVVN